MNIFAPHRVVTEELLNTGRVNASKLCKDLIVDPALTDCSMANARGSSA
jgi:hypothetical protein